MAPEVSLLGDADGAEVIFGIYRWCGLRPCVRAHLNKGLVLYLPGGRAENK